MLRSALLQVVCSALLTGWLCPASAAETAVEVASHLGLTAESLAAAQCQAQDATLVVQAVAAEGSDHAALASTQILAASSLSAASSQAAAMANGNVGEGAAEPYMASLTALANHQQQMVTIGNSIVEAAMQGLSQPKRQRLEAWRSSLPYRVPNEFRVLSLDSSQWRAVERAVRAELRAAHTGHALAPEHAQLLDDIRSHADVIAAAAALETGVVVLHTHLASIDVQIVP